MTVMDATADKDPLVQEQISSALCSLGRAEPEEVLNACEEYLRQHEKVGHPSVVVSVQMLVLLGQRISAWMGGRGDSGRLFWEGLLSFWLAGDALVAPERRWQVQVEAASDTAPHPCPLAFFPAGPPTPGHPPEGHGSRGEEQPGSA